MNINSITTIKYSIVIILIILLIQQNTYTADKSTLGHELEDQIKNHAENLIIFKDGKTVTGTVQIISGRTVIIKDNKAEVIDNKKIESILERRIKIILKNKKIEGRLISNIREIAAPL